MNRKNKLAEAIYILEVLLGNDVQVERTYQKYFEENSIVFESLGYTNSYPMVAGGVELQKDSATDLKPEPDFIVENEQGLYEIFELKTPVNKKLTIDRNAYRKKFSSEVQSYIAQVITYEKYFSRNPENRKFVLEKYNLDIQEDLDITVIIGRDEYINKKEIHSQLRNYNQKINFFTFDDLLKKLKKEYKKEYGIYEGLPGFGILLVINLSWLDLPRNQFIVDMGESISKNRISLFMTPNKQLCFRVIDDLGNEQVSFTPLESSNVLNQWSLIHCEYGKSQHGYVFNLYINGKEVSTLKIQQTKEVQFKHLENVLGASIEKNENGKFQLAERVDLTATITGKQRIQIIQKINYDYNLGLTL